MPVWHELTQQARDKGELVVLGVIQEQHPDRCRLFAQWKGLNWPILHDPVNSLKPRAVPIFVALDESGIVVDSNLRSSELASFLQRPPNDPSEQVARSAPDASNGNDEIEADDVASLIEAGDRAVLWGGQQQWNDAINLYTKAVEMDPNSGAAWFRLGVARRMRYDSASRRENDFQAAVDAWGRALDADPNHYIYRRRIQQYGPRLIKPYPFYDWIGQAREAILARGDQPVDLTAEPVGAEIASPIKSIAIEAETSKPPDPTGRIGRDAEKLITATVTVVPGRITKGEAVRVHLQLLPSRTSHWNNESEPLRIWIDVPTGWQVEDPLLELPQPSAPESRERRSVDFELKSPQDTNVESIQAYALYYVCEEEGGQCLYRRQDIEIPIRFRK